MRRAAFLLVLLVPLVLAAGCGGAAEPAAEPAPLTILDAIASEIAHRPVTVRCVGEELPDYGPGVVTHGVVWFRGDSPGDHTVIAPNLCRELVRIHGGGLPEADARCLRQWAGLGCGDRIAWAALAMATLAHEAYHLAGVKDERAADCYGIQTVEVVARRLGMPEAEAQGIAAFARVNHRVGQGAEYASGECREGGALDLDPAANGGLG